MASPINKLNRDKASVNQRCAEYQPIGDPMLQSVEGQTGKIPIAHRSDSQGGGGGAGKAAQHSSDTKLPANQQANATNRNLSSAGNQNYVPVQQYQSYVPHQLPGVYGSSSGPSGGPGTYMPYTMSLNNRMMPQVELPPDTLRFLSSAHESSEGMFSRAASVIHTVGSVTFMLDSIFMSCTSSFHAILDVIGQLSHLKSRFGRVLSAFAVIRSVKWLYGRLLQALGLRTPQDLERLWKESLAHTSQAHGSIPKKSRQWWLRALLLSLLCSLPLLVLQLIKVFRDLGDDTGMPVDSAGTPGDDGSAAAGCDREGRPVGPLYSNGPYNTPYSAANNAYMPGAYNSPYNSMPGAYSSNPYNNLAAGYNSPYSSLAGGYNNPHSYPSNGYNSSYSSMGNSYPHGSRYSSYGNGYNASGYNRFNSSYGGYGNASYSNAGYGTTGSHYSGFGNGNYGAAQPRPPNNINANIRNNGGNAYTQGNVAREQQHHLKNTSGNVNSGNTTNTAHHSQSDNGKKPNSHT